MKRPPVLFFDGIRPCGGPLHQASQLQNVQAYRVEFTFYLTVHEIRPVHVAFLAKALEGSREVG